MFAAAQDRLARNQAWALRRTQEEYLLRRLVSCRRCGRAESVGNNGRYAYYRCAPRAGDPEPFMKVGGAAGGIFKRNTGPASTQAETRKITAKA